VASDLPVEALLLMTTVSQWAEPHGKRTPHGTIVRPICWVHGRGVCSPVKGIFREAGKALRASNAKPPDEGRGGGGARGVLQEVAVLLTACGTAREAIRPSGIKNRAPYPAPGPPTTFPDCTRALNSGEPPFLSTEGNLEKGGKSIYTTGETAFRFVTARKESGPLVRLA